ARRASIRACAIADSSNMVQGSLEASILTHQIDVRDGKYTEALDGLHADLARAEEQGDQEAMCSALFSIGNVFFYQGNTVEALAFYRKVLDRARSAGFTRIAKNSVFNIGAVLGYTDGVEVAIQYYQGYLDTARSITPDDHADVLINMVDSYIELKQYDTALEVVNRCLAILIELGDEKDIAKALQLRATIHWDTGRKQEALEDTRKALSMTRSPDLRARLTLKHAKYLNGLGHHAEAYQELNAYRLLRDTLVKARYNDAIALSKVRFETTEKELRLLEQERTLSQAAILQGESAAQRNLFIGTTAVLLIIALLLFRTIRSKKRLAQKEKELHHQVVDGMLNQQEIKSINAMLEGQEKERERFAKDLHDHLGGLLSAIKHQLGSVEVEVAEVRQDQGIQYAKMHSMLDEASGEVRRISHDMITVALSRFGLDKALEDLCDSVRVKGRLDVELRHFGTERRMERSMEIAVYRIVQEAISNILKYADATELSVDITRRPDHVSAIIHDNGKGFDTQVPSSGIGLENMRQRAAAVGGMLRVESTLGNGTTVSVEVPVVE
ncbi:MAG: sensor histidine kinase, partial [Flavobacteriales bacterium]